MVRFWRGFVGCFDSIEAFLSEKDQVYPELEDENGFETFVSHSYHRKLR